MIKTTFLCILLGMQIYSMRAQCVEGPPGSGNYRALDGGPCANAIPTAVPFLRLISDARAGALGDAGIAISPDVNSVQTNSSKLAFVEDKVALSASYIPWFKLGGNKGAELAQISGFYKLDTINTVGLSIKYFSLGNISFPNLNGSPQSFERSNEYEITGAYARRIGDRFSIGLNSKFIHSTFGSGTFVNGEKIDPANSVAFDLSFYYKIPLRRNEVSLGLALTNIGSKISYLEGIPDFLPANLGFGAAWNLRLNEGNHFTIVGEFNKLMVPTPQHELTDVNTNGFNDYREKGLFKSIFESWSDAPDGFNQELKEITFALGVEYWYRDRFALRTGISGENHLKGGRQYFTIGSGIKIHPIMVNISYLISGGSSQQNVVKDNIFRLTAVCILSKDDKPPK